MTEQKEVQLRNEVYLLDIIQEGAKPIVEVDEEKKEVVVSELWVSSHYEEEEEVPSAYNFFSEVVSIVEKHYEDFRVKAQVYDINGKENSFDSAE